MLLLVSSVLPPSLSSLCKFCISVALAWYMNDGLGSVWTGISREKDLYMACGSLVYETTN